MPKGSFVCSGVVPINKLDAAYVAFDPACVSRRHVFRRYQMRRAAAGFGPRAQGRAIGLSLPPRRARSSLVLVGREYTVPVIPGTD